ncbi:hypothetical protein QJQ45_016980 [Haematococcus lacustris]|nr:hypothetical protein QJQ45_016980 [Haematococcus lacustris]
MLMCISVQRHLLRVAAKCVGAGHHCSLPASQTLSWPLASALAVHYSQNALSPSRQNSSSTPTAPGSRHADTAQIPASAAAGTFASTTQAGPAAAMPPATQPMTAEQAEAERQRLWDEEDDQERLTGGAGPPNSDATPADLEVPSTFEILGGAAVSAMLAVGVAGVGMVGVFFLGTWIHQEMSAIDHAKEAMQKVGHRVEEATTEMKHNVEHAGDRAAHGTHTTHHTSHSHPHVHETTTTSHTGGLLGSGTGHTTGGLLGGDVDHSRTTAVHTHPTTTTTTHVVNERDSVVHSSDESLLQKAAHAVGLSK